MNDNAPHIPFESRRDFLMSLVEGLEAGQDGYAGRRAIIRELEAIEPGIVHQMHAREVAKALRIPPLGVRGGERPDLSFLDYAGA